MLDDLRNSSSFIDDDEPQNIEEQEVVKYRPSRRRKKEPFLGMTAQQRFIISLVLFFMVCILGVFALLASGSIGIPF
jgi:hypothetical protein